METYLNTQGDECVIITNDDGTSWSGLKSAYDEMLKQAEQSTPMVASNE
jgi:broad specificity polyphosphatase/5'/3'-nucleotidase SurE